MDEPYTHSHSRQDTLRKDQAITTSMTNEAQFAVSVLSTLTNAFHATSVLVSTVDGIILYGNSIAAKGLTGDRAQSVVGVNLLDSTPKPWAQERLEYMKLAIQRERPLTMIEILVGTRLSSTITPIRPMNANDDWLLLITVEHVTPKKLKWLRDNINPEDLIEAEVVDLGRLSVLSPRELEVLALMGQGLRQKQIAERLHRSISTVDRHRERIGEKLGITDRVELIALAREAALEFEDSTKTNVTIRCSSE